jgi:hypothetical protein
MKTFIVEGWYRPGDFEKEFEEEEIKCSSVQVAIQIFTDKYDRINFYQINTKEV